MLSTPAIQLIEKQVANFLFFKLSGWKTELALECCHDMVADLIDIDSFITLCQEAVK